MTQVRGSESLSALVQLQYRRHRVFVERDNTLPGLCLASLDAQRRVQEVHVAPA